jgi:hypothetical protein
VHVEHRTVRTRPDARHARVSALHILRLSATVRGYQTAASTGTLTLTTLAGLTFSTGDGTADASMVFTGTLSAINAALATASFVPGADFNGAATVTLQVTDSVGGVIATGTGVPPATATSLTSRSPRSTTRRWRRTIA